MPFELLKQDLSLNAIEKLNHFKLSANPTINENFNSSDEVIWYEIIIQLHLDQHEIGSNVFKQWLI